MKAMILSNHLPALQVLIVLFGALFTIVTNQNIARYIAIISTSINLGISIYCLSILKISASYHFGDFPAPIGIEYKLDYLNQPFIIYINSVLLFLLLFCHKLIKSTILDYISNKRQNLFYSILLFAHTGYIGIMSTNDIFNLYVFIEIASLSSYVLIAQGNNKKAPVGAFDYLMLGTIGATLILISIGFLLEHTGSLNIADIKKQLYGHYHSNIVITAISFFLIGSMLKTPFFPMHFWMIRSYLFAPTVILIYIAGISSIVGIYIFLRFINFTIEYNEIIDGLSVFLRPIAFATLIICPLLALKNKTIKKIILYSVAAQIGYIFLLSIIPDAQEILLQFLLIDSVNKVALFFIIACIEEINNYQFFIKSKIHCFLVAIIIICSSSLPVSKMFLIKLDILNLLIKKNLWVDFAFIIISASTSLLYHYKLATILFWNNDATLTQFESEQAVEEKSYNNLKIQTNITQPMLCGLILIILVQFVLLLQ